MKNVVFIIQFFILCIVSKNIEAQTISGHVYIDVDFIVGYSNGDRGIGGVKVNLYNNCNNGAMVASSISDSDGFYTFNVSNGDYKVAIDANDLTNGTTVPKNCCFQITNALQNEKCEFSQEIPNCTSNPYSVDNLCEEAFDNPLLELPVIGDIACGRNPPELGPWHPAPHCEGVFSNTSFYGFIAGSGSYSVQITVFSCAGKGLQYGIMDACNPSGPYVICNGNANTGTFTISGNDLVPCKKYILWINGFEGSVCSYYAKMIGDFKKCDSTSLKPLEIDFNLSFKCDSMCNQNFSKNLNIIGEDSLSKIDQFKWSISNASTTIQQTTSTPDIDISSLSPDMYNICVQIDASATNAKTEYCKQIIIQNDYSVVKNTFTLCEKELPWFGAHDRFGNKFLDEFGNHWRWEQGPIIWSDLKIGRNTFINDRKDKCGCSYQQEITVIYHLVDEPCDDLDETTENDIVLDDCTCKGTERSGIAPNTSWYYRHYSAIPNNDVWIVRALRDTIIDQHAYKIVGINRGSGFLKQSELPIAMLGGQMYFFEGGERKLLYDFNANVGDIVTYYVPKVQRYYDISSNEGFTIGKDKAYKLKVDRIDTLMTAEGKILKRFRTSATERNEEFHYFNDIIEGVGGTLGLFGAFGPFLSAGSEGTISCFQDENGFYSIFGNDCELVHSEETMQTSTYTIFPNPSRNQIVISGMNASITNIQCKDLSGKNIQLSPDVSDGNIVVDIHHLPIGMYVIILKNNDSMYPIRFVKIDN